MSEELIVYGGDSDLMTVKKTYILKVDPLISNDDANYFFKRVNEILEMDVRWKNHNFKYVGHTNFNDADATPPKESYDFIIVLLDRTTKHKLLETTDTKLNDQPLTDGFGKVIDFKKVEFSYTFQTIPAVVVIDELNWRSAHESLGITKSQYEQYVIFHEVGHVIGKSHRPIPNDVTKPYPIMYQATLGLPDLKRFVPHPNESD
jgi:hypothetical protein